MLDGVDAITELPVREGAAVPEGAPPLRIAEFAHYRPQWEAPDFLAEPWESAGEECVKYYETPTYIYHYTVPEGWLIHIWSMCYTSRLTSSPITPAPPPPGAFFSVEVLRDHETLLRFKDRVIPAPTLFQPVDAGNRYTFCSTVFPVPISVHCDRRQTLSARVTIHNNNVSAPLPALIRFRILFGGYRSTLTASSQARGKQQRFAEEHAAPFVDRAVKLFKVRGGRF